MKTQMVRTLVAGACVVSVLGLTAASAAASRPWDTQGSWARPAINSLLDKGVLAGYPDGSFRPEKAVTRAEFAKMVVTAMNLPTKATFDFSDLPRSHWGNGYVGALEAKGVLTGYPDGSFGPKRSVTRAEMTAVLTRVLDLADKSESYTHPQPASYSDVPAGSWAFNYVETARKLGIVPGEFGSTYHPAWAATRAEAAYMLSGVTDLSVVKGRVAWVDPYAGSVSVSQDSGGQALLKVNAQTTLFRNNVTSDATNMQVGDRVYAVSTAAGGPRMVKATGQVTKTDVLNKVSSLTKGTLTPYQVQAIATGDWNSVKTDLSATLLAKLMENGLQYSEASALMNQDWTSLQGDAKTRLTQALSQTVGVQPGVLETVANQDWHQAGEAAKAQVAQAVLQKVMAM